MDWSPVLAALPQAVPILAGGLVAIASGAVIQYCSHHLTRQREAKKLRLTKTEDLLCALYAHRDWTSANQKAFLSQRDYEDPSPLNRAYAIQRLYFPELAPPFKTFAEAVSPYEEQLALGHYTAQQRRDPTLQSALPEQSAEIRTLEDLLRAYEVYKGAWEQVVAAVLAVIAHPKSPR